MLVRYPAAVAVKEFLIHLMEIPVMIIGKHFSALPLETVFLFRESFNERLFNKYIKCINAALGRMLFKIVHYFRAKLGLYKMEYTAAKDNINIFLSSGFRSYDYQKQIYDNYCSWYGQESADTFSARPGNSEHQTGLAIDVNIVDDSFTGTAEAIWLENHCWEYGFIIRYPRNKQSVTGYKYEPWHIRYVGTDMSKKIHDAGDITLEEYFGITSQYPA